MSELSLRLFTDPVLRKPCELVEKIDEEIIQLVEKMIGIMYKNKGVGLTANQVGILKQVVIVNLENQTKLVVMINPKIVAVSKKDKIKVVEGCLSVPKIPCQLKRYKIVRVECLNLKGEKELYEVSDFDAQIIQHELDHINGITILDRSLK